jgi:hypothetical protein
MYQSSDQAFSVITIFLLNSFDLSASKFCTIKYAGQRRLIQPFASTAIELNKLKLTRGEQSGEESLQTNKLVAAVTL